MKIRWILLFSFLMFTVFLHAQKTDTLVHINGNILTGEIKKLEYGILSFKTNGMGTLNVETQKIKSLKSRKKFRISLDNGLLYFGSLDTVNGTENKVKIISETQVYVVNIFSLVEIFPIKNTFWLRTSGDFSLGGNYTKSTEILQLNMAGNLYYRGKKTYYRIFWDNQLTMIKDSVISDKKTNTISYQQYFVKHYSFMVLLGVSTNLDLNLENRIYLNVTAGKDIIHTNKSVLYSGLGVSANREEYVDTVNNSLNVEGILALSYDFFKRTDPQINIISSLNAYPSFTVWGRWRIDASVEARFELFKDFYIGIKYYDNFDNNTKSETDNNHNDWGINGTLTYSFH